MTSIIYLAKVADVTIAVRLNLTKLIFILIFITAGLILIHPVLAQDATPSTTRRDKVKERVEVRKEKLATREAALKARLEKFKDKKKAEIADRVNTNLNKINQKQTEQMLKHLDKMSGLLDKLEARVNRGSPDVKDPVTAKAAIADARAKIGAAKTEVKTQAEKDYTLTVSSESKVKADAKKIRDQLRQDLQAVRKQVIEAKQSVGKAIRVAKSGKEATNSGQQ